MAFRDGWVYWLDKMSRYRKWPFGHHVCSPVMLSVRVISQCRRSQAQHLIWDFNSLFCKHFKAYQVDWAAINLKPIYLSKTKPNFVLDANECSDWVQYEIFSASSMWFSGEWFELKSCIFSVSTNLGIAWTCFKRSVELACCRYLLKIFSTHVLDFLQVLLD